MTDAEFIEKVSTMTESELLDQVMASPEFLTDGYYRNLGDAMNRRYKELRRPPTISPTQKRRRTNRAP